MNRKIMYWLVFFAILVPAYIFTWNYNHEIFLRLNGFLPWLFGYPMLFLSAMADGLFVLMISSATYNKKKGFYWAFLVSYFVSATIVQVIKNNYSSGRPLAYYSPDQIYYAGEILRFQSFPSGHSNAAMVLSQYLMYISGNIKLKIFFFIFGCLCAFSRIYIGAHFPADVLTGSLIGFFLSYFIFLYARKLTNHTQRPEYKYNTLIISLIGITASISFILFDREKYAPLSFPVLAVAAGFLFFFLHKIWMEFLKIYHPAAK